MTVKEVVVLNCCMSNLFHNISCENDGFLALSCGGTLLFSYIYDFMPFVIPTSRCQAIIRKVGLQLQIFFKDQLKKIVTKKKKITFTIFMTFNLFSYVKKKIILNII